MSTSSVTVSSLSASSATSLSRVGSARPRRASRKTSNRMPISIHKDIFMYGSNEMQQEISGWGSHRFGLGDLNQPPLQPHRLFPCIEPRPYVGIGFAAQPAGKLRVAPQRQNRIGERGRLSLRD